VHPTFRTPSNAIIAQFVVTLIWAFVITGLAILANPSDRSIGTAESNQYYIYGTSGGFQLIFIYISVNVACFWLYFRERRSEFNPILHLVFPALSTIGMLVVGWVSLHPLPAAPYVYAIPATFAWILLGIVVLVYLRAIRREDWIAKAGEVTEERPATEEELEAMRGEW